MGALRLGPVGAALGTTLSQGISVAFSLSMIYRRRRDMQLQRGDFRPKRPVMGQILKIGVPVALQDG